VDPMLKTAILGGLCLLAPHSFALSAEAWRNLDPQAVLVIDTTKGRIIIEMRPDFAPNAVARIKLLAREHVYDGLLFHRVLDHYVDQTGNPDNHDGGASKYPNLQPEFKVSLKPSQIDSIASHGPSGLSGFVGTMPFAASYNPGDPSTWRAWGAYCDGVVGMGREADPGSANSEVFLMRAPSRSLDHDYTAWGRVVFGLDVVRQIAVGEPPANPDRMLRVQVMADMRGAQRPRIQVVDTRSARFRQGVEDERRRRGADFSVCDVQVDARMEE
jgi:peptidylprolyl isomerase